MNNLEPIISNFPSKYIIVIGDIMLDKYLEGEVTRMNVEAPVPIVNLKKEYSELGGAANVASNVVSLGGKVSLFGFLGNDESGTIVKDLLRKKNIDFILEENKMTITKTRVTTGTQQLIRFDKEEKSENIFSEGMKKIMIEKIEKADLIIISDYNKGTITVDLIGFLSKYKNKIIVDPKPQNKHLFKGVFLVKTNKTESFEMSFCSDVEAAGNLLRSELNANIIITRGNEGMSIFSTKRFDIPTFAKEVYDVTGAGDTAIAALALAIASGADLGDAAIISNYAAGISIEKRGTYSVKLKELKDKIFSEGKKIVSFDELIWKVEENKRKKRKIVWTNGCFDLLHIGHVKYLKEAKKLGDILIVGLNSDNSIKRLKGPTRPIQSELERAEILSSLEFIDYVMIFPEDTVDGYLTEIKPDVYVKGGDHSLEDILSHPEGKAVKEYGGEIKIISLIEGKSTTGILEEIKKREGGFLK